MSGKKTLLIIHRRYLIEFILFEFEQTGYKIKFKEKFPIINLNSFKYSLSEYVLECLDKWGKDIGVSLVEKKVPIISTDGKNGVSEIILFTKDKKEDFTSITSDINRIDNKLSHKGVKEVTQRINFAEMISVFQNVSDYRIIRYSNENGSNVKVKSKSINIEWEKINSEKGYRKRVNKFSNTVEFKKLHNYLKNSEKQISFLDKSMGMLLPEFIYYWYLIGKSFKEDRMNISSFGQGPVKESLILLGGDFLKYSENVPMILICLLSSLRIIGNFTIYLDVFGILEYVQSLDNIGFNLSKYLKSIVEFWGYGFSFDYRNGEGIKQIGDKIAVIEISDGDKSKDYTLKNGEVVSLWSEMQSKLSIQIADKYFLADTKRQSYENVWGNLFFDARIDPDRIFNESIFKEDIIKGWLKTSKALNL